MKIDRNNYEIYFIDYLDGNLSLGEIDSVLDFLNENPDLKQELKGLEHIHVGKSDVNVPSFNHLKKTDLDHPEIFEETCIRAIENDLTEKEQKLFEQYLSQNTAHRREFALFRSTILEPDPFIVFAEKESLKKKAVKIMPIYWYAAAAVLLLGLFLLIPDRSIKQHEPENVIAEATIPSTNNTEEKVIAVQPEVRQVAKAMDLPKSHTMAVHVKTEEALVVLAEQIERVTTPAPMISKHAVVEPVWADNSEMALMPVDVRLKTAPRSYSKYLTLEEYLANKIDEAQQNGQGTLSKFALNTLKKISGDKFDYSTSDKGKVQKLEFNSKLLAFTIPVGE